MARPSNAELLEGTYVAAVIELHRQGNTWTAVSSGIATTIDNNALVVNSGLFVFQLTKG
ncbi:hypothetical protein [Mycobacterium sp. 1274761.0]|uniref:hypothetical protein n=1 Tax=Mycobacterium sp. 1274761.0 TaxID=1834077 RepID=UPI0012E94ABA|nr:hypothetical protein [Mycobacterium sp. 1274761.0]